MAKSPEHARFLPLASSLSSRLTGLGLMGGNAMFWLIHGKSFRRRLDVWEMRRFIPEIRGRSVGRRLSWASWFLSHGSDSIRFIPRTICSSKTRREHLESFARFGENSGIAWTLMVIRIFGMTIIVPPIEEAFYRSLVYRYIVKYDFTKVALNHFDGVAMVLCASLFGFAHFNGCRASCADMAYQWLVFRRGHLGDAMTAHAITNFPARRLCRLERRRSVEVFLSAFLRS
jgi:membrane protease YdiL (CAAX protease family)